MELLIPFLNFNVCTIEVWKWINKFFPHFMMDNYVSMLRFQLNQEFMGDCRVTRPIWWAPSRSGWWPVSSSPTSWPTSMSSAISRWTSRSAWPRLQWLNLWRGSQAGLRHRREPALSMLRLRASGTRLQKMASLQATDGWTRQRRMAIWRPFVQLLSWYSIM